MHRFFIIVLLSFSSSFLYAQEASWFVGTWKSGSLKHERSSPRQTQSTISISSFSASGNSFEGTVKIVVLKDTSTQLIYKVKGYVNNNSLIANLGENIYRKDPRDGKWNTDCEKCGPVTFVFSKQEDKFVLTGEIKGCSSACDRISIYSRDINDFDPVVRASLDSLISSHQQIAKTEVIPEDVKPSPKPEGSLTAAHEPIVLTPVIAGTHLPSPKIIDTLKENKKIENENVAPAAVASPLPKPVGILLLMPKPTVVKPVTPNTKIRLSQTVAISTIKKEYPVAQVVIPPPSKPAVALTVKPETTVPKTSTTVNKPPPKKLVDSSIVKKETQNTNQKKPAAVPATIKPVDTLVAVRKANVPPAEITQTVKPAATNNKPAAIVVPAAKPQEVYEKRTNTFMQVFIVNTDSVTLKLFDNGIVDGDIVSVFLNDNVVVNHLTLATIAYEIKIPIDKTIDNKVVLYAHNLGEISPNTCLLQIFSGKIMHSLTLSSDLQTSSGIILRYADK